MLLVIGVADLFMPGAAWISRFMGDREASVIRCVIGMVPSSIAATHFLTGIKEYFL